MVKAGSHIFGDIFLRTRLLGISLFHEILSARGLHSPSIVTAWRCEKGHKPRDIGRVIDRKPSIVLPISHFQARFQSVGLGISDICAVEEGAEEEESENGQNSGVYVNAGFILPECI
jgi:hypothetical protein